MRYKLTFGFLLLFSALPASATNAVYLATAAAGGNTGANCANAKAQSYFNSGANWSATPTGIQIGPDTTVHLCGTFVWSTYSTPLFIFQGSGTTGHPVTVLFEPGADVQSPAFGFSGNGAFQIGASHVVINGGGTVVPAVGAPTDAGIIENTANGGLLANHLDSNAINIAGGTDVVVKNLIVRNICVMTLSTGTGCNTVPGGGSAPDDVAIKNDGASNVTITHNTVSDSMACIFDSAPNPGPSTGNVYSFNREFHCNWGITVAASATANTETGALVHDNDIKDAVNWDTYGSHHNGVFFFTGSGGTIKNCLAYNNFIHGDFGFTDTSFMFNDRNPGTGAGADVTGNVFFNNVLASESGTGHAPSNAYITGLGNADAAYNNTIDGNGFINSGANEGAISANQEDPSTAKTYNNIITQTTYAYWLNHSIAQVADTDYNDIFSLTKPNGDAYILQGGSGGYTTVAAWTAATGFDSHSVTTNPNLSGTYTISPSSPAAGTGKNLTSLCVGALVPLCKDKNGNARPAGGPWDMGAYNSGGAPPPAPPSGLTVIWF